MHTPAPWQVVDTDSSTVDVRCARGLLVAEVGDTSLEDAANARLIAAAPDLLAALQSLVAVCENEGFPHLGNILPMARAAIDKATGA